MLTMMTITLPTSNQTQQNRAIVITFSIIQRPYTNVSVRSLVLLHYMQIYVGYFLLISNSKTKWKLCPLASHFTYTADVSKSP